MKTSTRSAPGASTWTAKLRPTESPTCGAWISALVRGVTVGAATGTTTGAMSGAAGTEPRLGTTTCTLLNHVPRSGVCAANVSVVVPNGKLLSGIVTANPAVLQSGLSTTAGTSVRERPNSAPTRRVPEPEVPP